MAYLSIKSALPATSIEPSFMAKTQTGTAAVKSKDGLLGDADTLYAGMRLTGKLPGRFDYSFEGVRGWRRSRTDAITQAVSARCLMLKPPAVMWEREWTPKSSWRCIRRPWLGFDLALSLLEPT